jgi:phosphate starvation-inducible protein PhoH
MSKSKKPAKINNLGFKLLDIAPITKTQNFVFESFYEKNLLLHGIAGTGKTFVSLYLALREILEYGTYHKIYIIRSAVPTRDVGFMPGTLDEKLRVYEAPYKEIVNNLLGRGDAYDIMKQKGIIEFMSTSFVRGLTIDKSVVIVDEIQNLSFGELDSVMTRVGEGTKIIFAGDFRQSDLKNSKEKSGIHDFMKILNKIEEFEHIEFREQDIVRSGIVKKYIITKNELGLA